MCSVERFYLNSLYRCPKLTTLDALEKEDLMELNDLQFYSMVHL
jgi:hypothetical protein